MAMPYPAPYAPPPKQVKTRRWPWVLLAVLTLLIGIGIGSAGKGPTTTTPYAPTGSAPTVTAPRGESPAIPPPAPVSGPQTSFTDGTYVVGEDIVPGTYKSAGATVGLFELCSVTTYKGDSADGGVINFAVANANEPVRVKVTAPAKSVRASGCEPFVKVG